MDTILWNQDTADWSVGQPGGPAIDMVTRNMQQWLTGDKTPGLIILEHEITEAQIQIFINAYPLMKSNGWNLVSVAQLGPTGSAYQNANGTTGPVYRDDILVASPPASSSVSSNSAPTSTSTSTVSSATPTATQGAHVNGAMASWHGTTPRWGALLAGYLLFTGVGLMS